MSACPIWAPGALHRAETHPHAKPGKETTINIPWVTAPAGFEPTLGKFPHRENW
ncbi:uncharacterized protein H6S33_008744 [Morchella sextelata]|uniref:uncharacterized protein n=1 Tax=Morchella sextelata TaxID=1174677 RepID=UPI001D0560CB|nr:uncharacterized protein H6S33_008744 [Morchella sextelata]KAH0602405.1 hypothetical protein H6S33_008744 [Morchella sextelata]